MAHGVKRKTFTHNKIAAFWGMPEPYFCMRCAVSDREVPLERAHVIDLGCGGLDALHNIGFLCAGCHAVQPMSGRGGVADEEAYEYFGLDPHEQRLVEPRGMWDRRIEYLQYEIEDLEAHLKVALWIRNFESTEEKQ